MSDIPAGTPPGEPGGTLRRRRPGSSSITELLFSVVYNMLGSVADTEDALQETWLAWVARTEAASGEQIADPRAYLVQIAVNRATARQASISRRREDYAGPWLPEPLLGEDQAGDSAEPVMRAKSGVHSAAGGAGKPSPRWNARCSCCMKCSATHTPRSSASWIAARGRSAIAPNVVTTRQAVPPRLSRRCRRTVDHGPPGPSASRQELPRRWHAAAECSERDAEPESGRDKGAARATSETARPPEWLFCAFPENWTLPASPAPSRR